MPCFKFTFPLISKMRSSIALVVSASTIWIRQAFCATVGRIEYNAAPPNLSHLFNSSLFYTWRPRS